MKWNYSDRFYLSRTPRTEMIMVCWLQKWWILNVCWLWGCSCLWLRFYTGLIEFFIYFICFVLRMARSVGFLVTRLIMSTQCPLQASGEISLESFWRLSFSRSQTHTVAASILIKGSNFFFLQWGLKSQMLWHNSFPVLCCVYNCHGCH